MDPIQIPERLDPSSRIGDAKPQDRSGEKNQNRRKPVKAPAPTSPEDSLDADDSHQLDELA